MNINNSIIKIGLTLSLLVGISGCTNSIINLEVDKAIENSKGGKDKSQIEKFEKRFDEVYANIKNKKDYKKVPLKEVEDLNWFINQGYLVWDKQITKEQYISNGIQKFPENKETFEYLSKEFTK